MTAKSAGVRSRRMSTRDRLAVVLVPRPPYRVPRAHTLSTWSGLQLQLADGSQLGWADPSLAAFGAVTPIVRTDADG